MSGSGVGSILQSPTSELIKQAIRLNFSTSNNEAENEVALVRLDFTLILVAIKLKIRSNSQLIIEHIKKEYEANDERMTQYLDMVDKCLKKLDKWIFRRVSQEKNERVDALVEITVTFPINETIMLLVYLKVAPSITPEPICNTNQADSGWMLNIIKYLQIGEVPEDEKQAYKLCIQVAHFTFINDKLYR